MTKKVENSQFFSYITIRSKYYKKKQIDKITI